MKNFCLSNRKKQKKKLFFRHNAIFNTTYNAGEKKTKTTFFFISFKQNIVCIWLFDLFQSLSMYMYFCFEFNLKWKYMRFRNLLCCWKTYITTGKFIFVCWKICIWWTEGLNEKLNCHYAMQSTDFMLKSFRFWNAVSFLEFCKETCTKIAFGNSEKKKRMTQSFPFYAQCICRKCKISKIYQMTKDSTFPYTSNGVFESRTLNRNDGMFSIMSKIISSLNKKCASRETYLSFEIDRVWFRYMTYRHIHNIIIMLRWQNKS